MQCSPCDPGILVSSGVGKVWNLARLATDEAVKVRTLQRLARSINQMALRALDLEDLWNPE
jgi:hypothetical protein